MVDYDITNGKVVDNMSNLEYSLMRDAINILVHEYGYFEDNISKFELLPTKDNKKSSLMADLIVWNESKKKPLIIVELKSNPNHIPEREQLSHYMQLSGAQFGFWYNGVRKMFLESKNGMIVEVSQIPSLKKSKRSKLIPIDNPDEKLWRLFAILRPHLLTRDVVYALILILYAKFVDEKRFAGKHFKKFPYLEKDSFELITTILQSSNKSRRGLSFNIDVLEKIPKVEFSTIVLELRDFSISDSNMEAIAMFFFDRIEDSKTSNSFSVPTSVLKMLFYLLHPAKNTSVDVFFIGMGRVIFELIQYYCDSFELTGNELKDYSERFTHVYEKNTQQADIVTLLIKLKDFKINISKNDPLSTNQISSKNIIAFPPFGMDALQNDNYLAEFGRQYENQLLVRLIQNISDGGYIATIVSPSFMSDRSFGTKKTHEMILSTCSIKTIIKLPRGIFYPTTGIGGVILLLEKNPSRRSSDKIFVSDIDIVLGRHDILDQRLVDEIHQKYNEFEKTNNVENPTQYGFTITKNELIKNDWLVSFKLETVLKIPKNAKIVRLLDIAHVIPGRDYKQISSDSGKEISQIRITDLKDNSIQVENKITVPPRVLESKLVPIVHKNDLLFSIRGTIGKVAIVRDNLDAIINSNLVILRVDEKKILPHYLLRMFSHDYVKHQIKNKARGVYIQRINRLDLANLKIPLIPLEEQKEKLTNLIKLESDIEKQRKNLQDLESKRDILFD